MLTKQQIESLAPEQQLEYKELLASDDKEALQQFEYFFGFTMGGDKILTPTNEEIEIYKSMTDKIKLKVIAKMLNFIPHKGQMDIFYTIDERADIYNNLVMVLGRRAQTLDSIIKSPSGDITFKDVKVGDVIFDPLGGLQTVTDVHDIVEGDVYEVTVGDRKVRVDKEHLFTVIDHHGRERVLDVEYLKNNMANRYNFIVQNPKPIEYPEVHFTISPYALGRMMVNNAYSGKDIPSEYLRASVQQRVDVLRGAMDIAGDYVDDSIVFSTTSKPLMNSVVELVRSLGGNAIVDGDTCLVEMDLNPFYIERKASKFVPKKLLYNFITDITYVGKLPVRCITVSGESSCYITDDYIKTHNCGKSASTSVIACRELAVPFSSTILLTPTFNNAKIIFNEVLKNIQKLKLPIKSINRGAFRFELENGAKFSANSASNIESALGSYNSLLIVDESQSVPGLVEIMNQMLVPTLLDYGMRPSGILYGKQIYLGTPRGMENQLWDLFCRQDEFSNWRSFSSPSTSNPILPTNYFEQMRLELGEMLYRQEILAEFFGSDDNVFWAFDKSVNTYNDGDIIFNQYMTVVSGLDIGYGDSTAQIWAYRDVRGTYYLDMAYQKNMTSTSNHIKNYHEIEDKLFSTPSMRYGDPSAAQILADYNTDYGYLVHPAKNTFLESINYINQLFTPTGADNKPKLYINSNLTELIRQVTRVRWKDKLSKNSKDPFVVDPKKTHWDLIAALRYLLYSDSYNMASSLVVSSSR